MLSWSWSIFLIRFNVPLDDINRARSYPVDESVHIGIGIDYDHDHDYDYGK